MRLASRCTTRGVPIGLCEATQTVDLFHQQDIARTSIVDEPGQLGPVELGTGLVTRGPGGNLQAMLGGNRLQVSAGTDGVLLLGSGAKVSTDQWDDRSCKSRLDGLHHVSLLYLVRRFIPNWLGAAPAGLAEAYPNRTNRQLLRISGCTGGKTMRPHRIARRYW